MSLLKPRRVSQRQLAANRGNARKSTGPRTGAGKVRSRENAFKHGLYKALGPDPKTLRALGEDPEAFERLRSELVAAWGAEDARLAQQVGDLAKLYWRRGRLERARDGLVRRGLAALEAAEARQRREAQSVTYAPTEAEAEGLDEPRPESRLARLRQRLSFLELLRERVRERKFTPRLSHLVDRYCGENVSWRIPLIRWFLSSFAEPPVLKPPPGEAEYQKLAGWIEEEVSRAREGLTQAQQEAAREASAVRDACLASGGEEWPLLIRQENAVDRAIDRKVRILMQLRDKFEKKATVTSRSSFRSDSESVGSQKESDTESVSEETEMT